MRLFNNLHKYFVLPVSDKITGWNLLESLKFLNESQWFPKEKLYEFQCLKIQQLITHSYKNVPFYKSILDRYAINPISIKSPSDLKKLPILSKEEFRINFPHLMCSSSEPLNSFIKTATSGSTGRQLIYHISKNAYGFINAAALRGWNWMGFNLGDKYLKISQNKRNSVLKKLQDKINRSYLFTNRYDEAGFNAFVRIMNKFKPDYLRSYPDPLQFLANYLKSKESILPPIKAINTTGNILFPEVRRIVEKTFHTKIFDSYSCEGSGQLFECPTHTCYHVSDEYAITEILDENGQEVKPGERGNLVTTDLWNYTCPFIRYDTKDFVTKGSNHCNCGRGLSTVTKIDGRNNDILITPDGKYLIAQTFTTYFKYFESIEQFQIIQNTPDGLIFNLVTNKTYNNEIEKEIIKYWADYTNHNMHIFVESVEEISLLSSGKRQFLVRNPSIKLY